MTRAFCWSCKKEWNVVLMPSTCERIPMWSAEQMTYTDVAAPLTSEHTSVTKSDSQKSSKKQILNVIVPQPPGNHSRHHAFEFNYFQTILNCGNRFPHVDIKKNWKWKMEKQSSSAGVLLSILSQHTRTVRADCSLTVTFVFPLGASRGTDGDVSSFYRTAGNQQLPAKYRVVRDAQGDRGQELDIRSVTNNMTHVVVSSEPPCCCLCPVQEFPQPDPNLPSLPECLLCCICILWPILP